MIIVEQGTTSFRAWGADPIPAGWVQYTGPLVRDPADDLNLLMVWDSGISNIREMTEAEKLAAAKVRKIAALKVEAIKRARLIYDFINTPDFYTFAADLYTSIKPNAREQLSGRLLQFKNVKDTFDAKRAEINALTTMTAVDAYDLTAGW